MNGIIVSIHVWVVEELDGYSGSPSPVCWVVYARSRGPSSHREVSHAIASVKFASRGWQIGHLKDGVRIPLLQEVCPTL